MTATAFLLLAVAAMAMVGDWMAVASGARVVEWVLKPLVVVVLVLVALALDPSSEAARNALLIGLALSLVGDVALMVPADLFVVGLGAFLAAHVAYVVAMSLLGVHLVPTLVGLVVVVVGGAAVGRRIVDGATEASDRLRKPVLAYLGAISAMVVSAVGVGSLAAVAGGLLFYVSDAVLGWTRFVGDLRQGRVVVMVTYHLAQMALVLALV